MLGAFKSLKYSPAQLREQSHELPIQNQPHLLLQPQEQPQNQPSPWQPQHPPVLSSEGASLEWDLSPPWDSSPKPQQSPTPAAPGQGPEAAGGSFPQELPPPCLYSSSNWSSLRAKGLKWMLHPKMLEGKTFSFLFQNPVYIFDQSQFEGTSQSSSSIFCQVLPAVKATM